MWSRSRGEELLRRQVEVYPGRMELGAADDLEQPAVDHISDARETLGVAVQEINSLKIAEAIISHEWRGSRLHLDVLWTECVQGDSRP
jgi:hypothetical protein